MGLCRRERLREREHTMRCQHTALDLTEATLTCISEGTEIIAHPVDRHGTTWTHYSRYCERHTPAHMNDNPGSTHTNQAVLDTAWEASRR